MNSDIIRRICGNTHGGFYAPFGQDCEKALEKTTHLVIAAHQDDIEIMAQHGVLTCFDDPNCSFSAVVCADGAGSPRAGIYADYSNEDMMRIRIREQQKAAAVGDYGFLASLGFSSADIKDGGGNELSEMLEQLILAVKPRVIYTHNLADKHDTHVAVALRVIRALRAAAKDYRPEQLYGCEVWRGLDWVNDGEKLALDVTGHPALRAALLGVYDSQIEGGKRYDLAALGRQSSNATFYASHDTDEMDACTYAMDLLPLLEGGDEAEYINGYIRRFAEDVEKRIVRLR